MTAWNTAASFTTNTNWQNYSGECTMSCLTQMPGLAVQNFVSAAVGLVVAIALIRGFTRSRTDKLGNFWVDLTRAVIRLLTAGTGREALKVAASHPPDAIILDLGLPDIDGTEVIVELRRWYHAPIIVLSGRTSPGDKIGALDVGADDYVTKRSPWPSCWPGCAPCCAARRANPARASPARP